MRAPLLILALVTLTGCGNPLMDEMLEGGWIDPTLEPFVQEFAADAAAHGRAFEFKGLTVAFADLPGSLAGNCSYTSEKNLLGEVKARRTIRIRREYYDSHIKGSPLSIQAVVHHELAHCYLGRGHDDGLVEYPGDRWSNFQPIPAARSLMHTRTGDIPPTILVNHWDAFVEELFAK